MGYKDLASWRGSVIMAFADKGGVSIPRRGLIVAGVGGRSTNDMNGVFSSFLYSS